MRLILKFRTVKVKIDSLELGHNARSRGIWKEMGNWKRRFGVPRSDGCFDSASLVSSEIVYYITCAEIIYSCGWLSILIFS